jgi:hypothetical protein
VAFILILSGCGAQLSPNQSTSAGAAAAEVFTITRFDPPTGGVVVGGGTINITFSENQLDDLSVNAVTHFNLVCNGVTLSAASVIYSTGSSMAAVTLPSTSGIASGTSCNFIVSANLKDMNGVHLGGTRYVTYYIP